MSIFIVHLHLNELFAHMRYVVKYLTYLLNTYLLTYLVYNALQYGNFHKYYNVGSFGIELFRS